MYRVIKNAQAIFAMSQQKKRARENLEKHAQQIHDHLLKYVVYRDIRPNDLHHWLNELSAWLARADQISSKSKLTEKDYLETIFYCFGDELDDAEISLQDFYEDYVEKSYEPYPEFDITPDLVNRVFNAYTKLISRSINVFLSKQPKHSTSFWYRLIKESID